MTTSITARSAVGFTGSALVVIAMVTFFAGVVILLTGNESAILLSLVGFAVFTAAIGVLAAARRL